MSTHHHGDKSKTAKKSRGIQPCFLIYKEKVQCNYLKSIQLNPMKASYYTTHNVLSELEKTKYFLFTVDCTPHGSYLSY